MQSGSKPNRKGPRVLALKQVREAAEGPGQAAAPCLHLSLTGRALRKQLPWARVWNWKPEKELVGREK